MRAAYTNAASVGNKRSELQFTTLDVNWLNLAVIYVLPEEEDNELMVRDNPFFGVDGLDGPTEVGMFILIAEN